MKKKRTLNTKSLRPFQPICAYSSSSSSDEREGKTITPSARTTPDIIKSAATVKALQQQVAALDERINLATTKSKLVACNEKIKEFGETSAISLEELQHKLNNLI